MNYNCIEDPWYKKLLKKTDLITCKKAGYIPEDPEDRSFFNDFLFVNIPIHKINFNKISVNKKNMIILATGSYAPFHDGHIASVYHAKDEATRRGFNVIGAFVSPSHDNYVLNKYEVGKKYNIHERIHIINEKIKDDDFIECISWEGLYCKDSINFTTVIDYLERYLGYFTEEPIHIGYVVGIDNWEFSKAFIDKHYCFIVQRHNDKLIKEQLNSRSYFIPVENNNYSSTQHRKEALHIQTKDEKIEPQKYIIRVGNFENKYFKDESINQRFLNNLDWIQHELKEILKMGLPSHVNIEFQNLESNLETYGKLKDKYSGLPCISLDSCVKGDYNLQVSRLFNICSYQHRPSSFYSLDIDDNYKIKHIPSGSYWCLDDDYASGSTLEYVQKVFEHNNIEIQNYEFFNKVYTQDTYDTVDLRDFVIDSINGGLMVKYNQINIRVPYMLPFVSLVSRAKILPEKELEVSIKLWELNQKIFQDINHEPSWNIRRYLKNISKYKG